MFDVGVCETRRILLVTFRGEVSEADFAKLDVYAREAQGGPGYDVIFDLTAVEKAHLEADLVAKRGQIPQAFKDRLRFYVVPQDDLKLLVRLYAAYQESVGSRPPVVVATLKEAYESLQVTASDFRILGEPNR